MRSIKSFLAGPFYQKLVVLALVFLPFQYALTIRVGFPLKISELLLGAALLFYALSSKKVHIGNNLAGAAVAVLAICVVVSTVINATPPLGVEDPPPGYSMPLRIDILVYAGFGIFTLAAWALLRRIPKEVILRALLVSTWVSGAAALFQSVLGAAGAEGILSALGFRTVGVTGDASSLRSGAFLEGQHLGFYSGAMLLIALGQKRWLTALIAASCILYSESTTAWAGIAVGLLMALLTRLNLKRLLISAGAGGLLLVVGSLWDPLRVEAGRQMAKLGFTEFAPDYAYATTSLDTRTVKFEIAKEMFAAHPIFGVGPGRFGAWFYDYTDGKELPWEYGVADTRPIAENAYGQIAAELGLFALLAFVVLLFICTRSSIRKGFFTVALVGFCVVGVATQSAWTFMPIWVLIAYLTPVSLMQSLGSGSSSPPEGDCDPSGEDTGRKSSSPNPARTVPRASGSESGFGLGGVLGDMDDRGASIRVRDSLLHGMGRHSS